MLVVVAGVAIPRGITSAITLVLFLKRIRQGLHNKRLTVGILDVRAVRAVQGKVRKLLDSLFLIAFPMERRTENPRDRQLSNSRMEFYLLSHFSR